MSPIRLQTPPWVNGCDGIPEQIRGQSDPGGAFGALGCERDATLQLRFVQLRVWVGHSCGLAKGWLCQAKKRPSVSEQNVPDPARSHLRQTEVWRLRGRRAVVVVQRRFGGY